MNQYVQEFLKKTLEQVKYKKMHPYLAQELNDHIESLKEEFMEEGMDEEIAYQKAVAEMGEPEQIGISLHQIHKPKVEWSIILAMIGLVGIGVFLLEMLAMNSTRYAEARYIQKQGLFIGIGLVSFLIVYFIDYRKLEKLSVLFYIVAGGILMATLGIGREVNGVKRFLNVGPIMIRATSAAIPLFTVSYVAFVRKWANRGIMGYGIMGGTGLVATALCMAITPLEGFYMGILCLSIFMSYMRSRSFKGNKKQVVRGILSGGMLGIGFITWYICHSPQRVERIMGWIDPNRDPIDSGYLTNILREILSSATLFGAGKNIKIQHIDQYLPEINTDFLFAFIIGKLGYLVAVGVLVVIGIMLIRCFKAGEKVNDEYGRMMLRAITIFWAVQYMMSLFVNLSLCPVTAVSIPFMSYGGSRIVFDFALMGLFLSIYRRKDIVPCELLKEKIAGEEEKNKRYHSIILSWALHILKSSEDIEEVNITFREK